jgi:hypothetical protein
VIPLAVSVHNGIHRSFDESALIELCGEDITSIEGNKERKDQSDAKECGIRKTMVADDVE